MDRWIDFEFPAGFEYFTMNLSAIHITPDGKHIALAANSNTSGQLLSGYLVLYFERFSNQFKYHNIHNYGQFLTNAITMTDDHQWTASGHSDGNTSIYRFSGRGYAHFLTITHSLPVVSLSLTNDHQYLAISYDGNEVTLWKYQDESFHNFQDFYFSSAAQRKVQSTDEHQLLITH